MSAKDQPGTYRGGVESLEPRVFLAADPITSIHPLWAILPGTATIDGVLSESAWSSASPIRRAEAFRTNSSAVVRMMYDAAGLYISVDVKDTQLWSDGRGAGIAHRWEIETDDSMTFYFDPDQSRDEFFQSDDRGFGINLGNPDSPPLGVGAIKLYKHILGDGAGSGTDVNGSLLPTGLTWRTVMNGTVNNNTDTDVGWTTEMFLPWVALNLAGKPSNGQVIGMNFDIIFDNTGATRDLTDNRNTTARWTSPVFIDDHIQGVHSSYHGTQAGMHGPVNYASAMFLDPSAAPVPTKILNLAVANTTGYGTTLTFAAPAAVTMPAGSPSRGSVSEYEIRYSTSPIFTEAEWATATRYVNDVVPRPAGINESIKLAGLTPNTTYHVAVRAVNAAGNLGDLSNVVAFTTLPTSLDPSGGKRVTVSPLGRSLILENGQPFSMVGDHLGLSWFYTRNLYPGPVWDPVAKIYHNFNTTPPSEGPAAPYFQELKAHGINTMRVFLEAPGVNTPPTDLPLGTYWIESPAKTYNDDMRRFMLNLLKLATENGIYVILSPFETFSWDETFTTEFPWHVSKGGPLGNINNFFQTAQTLDLAKARIDKLVEWISTSDFAPYRHAILGWEALNEWDSYEWTLNSEGDADPGRETEFRRRAVWVASLATHIKQKDPLHLVMSSTTSLDPRGPTARLLFNSRVFDVLAPHFYTNANEEPINNPDANTSIRPAIEQANLTQYWLTSDEARRPLINGEWGMNRVDWPNGKPQYSASFTQQEDEAIFRTVLWSGLASGQAGTALRIPTDELLSRGLILTDTMRDLQLTLSNFLNGSGVSLDRAGFAYRSLSGDIRASSDAGRKLHAWGVTDGAQGIAYVLHDLNASSGTVSDGVLVLSGIRPDSIVDAEVWSTAPGRTGPLTTISGVFVDTGKLTLTLPAFTEDVAVKFKARAPVNLSQKVNGVDFGDSLVTFYLDAGGQPVARILNNTLGTSTTVDVAAAANFTGRVVDLHPIVWGGALNLAVTDENHHLWFFTANDFAKGKWSAIDLTALINAPGMTGDLTHYSPSWGAIHIAGLDGRGHAVNYWYAPNDTPTWQFSDLTALFNGPLMTGGLTGYVTGWDGLNLAGLNDKGETIVYWWAPDFFIRKGNWDWEMVNMTTAFSGPAFFGQLDAYVTPWGGLNIAGRTAAGELYTYWWVPGFTQWVVSNISSIGGGPTVAVGTEVVVSADGGINIFALDASDHLQLLRIAPEDQVWRSYDVTTLSSGPIVDFPVGVASVGRRLIAAARTSDATRTLAVFSLDTTLKTWTVESTTTVIEI